MLCYRRFFLVVKGEREKYKHVLINKCLSLCAVKWFNINVWKAEGKKVRLQPNSFYTRMKQLFSLFRAEGIQYVLDRDFNVKNQFGAILKATWKEGK